MFKTLFAYDLPTGRLLTSPYAHWWPAACRLTDIALIIFVCMTTVSISLTQIAYSLAIAFWLLQLYLHPQRLQLPLIVPISGFALASLLATLTAASPLASLIECRNLLEWAVFYLAVNTLRSEARATLFVRLLIAAGAVMALYGLSQALAHSADPAFRIAGASMYMTFGGQLMLISLLALSHLLFHPPSRHWFWLMPALVILLAALAGTQTRNAWLGFLAACPFLLSLRHRAFLIALPLLCLIAFALAPPAVRERIRSFGNLQDITLQERFSMWRSGRDIVRDYPWTGVGMGSMREMEKRYRPPDSLLPPERRLSHLHNSMVQIAAERGLIGLAGWIAIWVVFFQRGWRAYRQTAASDPYARARVIGSLACIIGFLIAGLFEDNFGDSEIVSMLYLIMALPFLAPASEPGASI